MTICPSLQASDRALSMEQKLDKVLTLLETCVERAEVDRLLGRVESSVKIRLEAVQEVSCGGMQGATPPNDLLTVCTA